MFNTSQRILGYANPPNPIKVVLRFDANQNWTPFPVDDYSQSDLLYAAVHEVNMLPNVRISLQTFRTKSIFSHCSLVMRWDWTIPMSEMQLCLRRTKANSKDCMTMIEKGSKVCMARVAENKTKNHEC